MSETESMFAEFWLAYPRRPGNPRKPAYESYKKLIERQKIDPAAILLGTKAYAATRAGEDARYTAHAATFLNQQRFLDFAPEPITAPIESPLFYAAEGTAQLDAWDTHWRATKGVNAPRDRKFGWWFATEWPPEGNVVAFRKSA